MGFASYIRDVALTKDFSFTVAGYYPGIGADVYIPWLPGGALMEELSGAVSLSQRRCYAADNTALEALAQAASQWFVEADPEAVTDPGRSGAAQPRPGACAA